MTRKTAIITGISGQDGAYLAQQLLERNYHVIGVHRPGNVDLWRLQSLTIADNPNLQLVEHTLTDDNANNNLIRTAQAHEVYNLAAISSLAEAHQAPLLTAQVNGLAPLSLLEAIRCHSPHSRFVQASSAEIFGANRRAAQTETTALAPTNVYAIAKAHAHRMVDYYRQQHGIFACNAVLYNHESPLRGEAFVTRKITRTLVDVAAGNTPHLNIGNLDALRDWGFAKDYTDALHRMTQIDSADCYLLCTGQLNSVRHFIELTAQALEMAIEWQQSGSNEIGVNRDTQQLLVRVDPQFYRHESVTMATGSPAKAKRQLRWQAATSLQQLCQLMVAAELNHRHG